jgi:hypothetical protein
VVFDTQKIQGHLTKIFPNTMTKIKSLLYFYIVETKYSLKYEGDFSPTHPRFLMFLFANSAEFNFENVNIIIQRFGNKLIVLQFDEVR